MKLQTINEYSKDNKHYINDVNFTKKSIKELKNEIKIELKKLLPTKYRNTAIKSITDYSTDKGLKFKVNFTFRDSVYVYVIKRWYDRFVGYKFDYYLNKTHISPEDLDEYFIKKLYNKSNEFDYYKELIKDYNIWHFQSSTPRKSAYKDSWSQDVYHNSIARVYKSLSSKNKQLAFEYFMSTKLKDKEQTRVLKTFNGM